MLKDRVLNHLMTGRCLHKKDLNRHLECTDVSVNPEKGAFAKIKKVAHRQTNKVTAITLSRMRADGS